MDTSIPDDGMVAYHLDPAMFPAELAQYNYGVPRQLRDIIAEAGSFHEAFKAMRAASLADKNLSPLGAHAARSAWVHENLPKLRKRWENVKSHATKLERTILEELTAHVAPPADEAADIALMQEVRSWLRSLKSDIERDDAVRVLTQKGDRTALRALLTAPAFLTGFTDERLAELRNEAAKQANPERHELLQAIKRAAKSAEQGVFSVIKVVEADLNTPPPMAEHRFVQGSAFFRAAS